MTKAQETAEAILGTIVNHRKESWTFLKSDKMVIKGFGFHFRAVRFCGVANMQSELVVVTPEGICRVFSAETRAKAEAEVLVSLIEKAGRAYANGEFEWELPLLKFTRGHVPFSMIKYGGRTNKVELYKMRNGEHPAYFTPVRKAG